MTKYYHGTSEESWRKIQDEGILLGKRSTKKFPKMKRMTWLSAFKETARSYGPILLEIELDWDKGENWWQFWTYEKITLDRIKRI